ncbi:MAG: bifunctional diaminohydroxyphosphoribosylaminopyrimidine deaminase/5-amino-6-(5-phosphoribosylamino)uracil reductase RibD [Planctomycetota bacterium]
MTDFTAEDRRWMQMAIDLSRQGEGKVEPNPMVGCVLVRDGQEIGHGFHRSFGGPHAEVDALARSSSARGATAYVTLEPCCHYGKTPPCSDALIAAGVGRVVVACRDPHPQVDGGGIESLRQAGIHVQIGLLAEEAAQVLAPFLKRVNTGFPWVIAKWAMSIDGRIATSSGQSQWITGEASRRQVHRLRSRCDGIVVGMGTVEADDPLLTARGSESDSDDHSAGNRTLHRIVYCRHRVPSLASQLVRSASQLSDRSPVVLVVHPSISDQQLKPLSEHGVRSIRCQSHDESEMVIESLPILASELGLTNVIVEGGSTLLGRFFDANQIDECHVYVGAKLIGGTGAPGPVGDPGSSKLADCPLWELQKIDQYDSDLRVIYRLRASKGLSKGQLEI